MSLEAELSKIREMSASRIPEEARKLMHGAVNQLRDSGALDSIIKVGEKLPAFSLKNEHGDTLNSSDLLANGGLVLTVFRGHW